MIWKEKTRLSRNNRSSVHDDIKKKRLHLLIQIEQFEQQAPHFLKFLHNSGTLGTQETIDITPNGWVTDDEDEEDEEPDETANGVIDGGDDEDEEKMLEPENIALSMPSTMGLKEQHSVDSQALVDMETRLWTAQANDALSQIRTGVGQKSYLAREKKKLKRTTNTTTRSIAAMRALTQKINEHARIYELAFKALDHLGAKGSFQPITKSDLNSVSDVSDPNRYGQSSDELSWIWRTGVPSGSEAKTEWLQDGKCLVIELFFGLEAHHIF
jgi:hypothetical protein